MNSTEQQQQMDEFYEQFAAAATAAHKAWCEDPANAFEILKCPWKAESPRVYSRSNKDIDPRSILNMIRQRKPQTANSSLTP